MDNAGSELERYLRELGDWGQVLEERAMAGGEADLAYAFFLALLILGALLWTGAKVPGVEFVGICILICVLGVVLIWYAEVRPLKGTSRVHPRRDMLYSHINERLFASGQFRQFLDGQAGGEGEGQLNQELISRFIDFFVDASFISRNSYAYMGHEESSRELIRALVMQVLATELLAGMSAFTQDSAESLQISSPQVSIRRSGWVPPQESELQSLLLHLQFRQVRRVQVEALTYAVITVLLSSITAFSFLNYIAYPGALLISIAGALFLASIAYAISLPLKRREVEHIKQLHLGDLEWDIFHNGLLRDHVHLAGGRGGVALLQDFARQYSGGMIFSQRYRGLPLRDYVLEVTVSGLLTRLRESPQEFEDW